MRVADLMQTDIRTAREDITLADAIVTFVDSHVYGVPVTDRYDRLIGVLSITDILEAAAECTSAEDRNNLFDRTLVSELMTLHPKSISGDTDVREAARELVRCGVHRLFVVEREELVGVISQSDIVRAVASSYI